jgi:hypothetical protein
VEGAHVRATRHDPTDHHIQICQHIPRSNAHHLKPFLLKKYAPSRVTPRLIANAVRLSIDFNNQPTAEAGKIDGNAADRELASKFQSFRAQS